MRRIFTTFLFLLILLFSLQSMAQTIAHDSNLNPKIKERLDKARKDRENAQRENAAWTASEKGLGEVFNYRVAGVKDIRSNDHVGGTPWIGRFLAPDPPPSKTAQFLSKIRKQWAEKAANKASGTHEEVSGTTNLPDGTLLKLVYVRDAAGKTLSTTKIIMDTNGKEISRENVEEKFAGPVTSEVTSTIPLSAGKVSKTIYGRNASGTLISYTLISYGDGGKETGRHTTLPKPGQALKLRNYITDTTTNKDGSKTTTTIFVDQDGREVSRKTE